VTPFRKSLLDSLSHLQLPATELVGRVRAREQPARPKELVQRREAGRGGLGQAGHGDFL
jgi:hypothetical protein